MKFIKAIAICMACVVLVGCNRNSGKEIEETGKEPQQVQLENQYEASQILPGGNDIEFELQLDNNVTIPENVQEQEEQTLEDVFQSIVESETEVVPELPDVSGNVKEPTSEQQDNEVKEEAPSSSIFVEPTEQNKFPNTGVFLEDD